MESNSNSQVRVGVFAAIGLLALLMSILSLGGNQSLFTSYVVIKAKMDQVQGLNKGSTVSLAGINIGNISEIAFDDKENAIIVSMSIPKIYLGKITTSATAEIRTQGALGDKYIYITAQPGGENVASDGFIQTAKSTDLMGVLSDKGSEAGKVFDIINEVYILTRTINANGRPEKIMENLMAASEDIEKAAADGSAMIADLRGKPYQQIKESAEKLDSILSKIDQGQGTLGGLVNDPTIHDRIKSIFGSTQRKNSVKSLMRSSID